MKADWKKIVGTVAPTLATALGGPLAGTAVKALATQLLSKPEASEDEVAQVIAAAGPPELLKLREIDVDYKKDMLAAGVRVEEIAAMDRASARDREIKTGDMWTPRILAALVLTGWFLIQWHLFKHVIASEMREIVMRTLGTLDMALGLVLTYFFGSSSSSRNKDDAIIHIAKME